MTARDYVEGVGARVMSSLRLGREGWRIFMRTLARVPRARRGEPGEILHQMFEIGNRSLMFILVCLGFLGMVLVYQTCLQLSRITGDPSPIGPEFLKIVIHEFGPTLTGMMLATRVGAGIAAEIGSMVVTEQVDALRMTGVAPFDFLVLPRVVASSIMALVLSAIGALAMHGAGGLTARLSF